MFRALLVLQLDYIKRYRTIKITNFTCSKTGETCTQNALKISAVPTVVDNFKTRQTVNNQF